MACAGLANYYSEHPNEPLWQNQNSTTQNISDNNVSQEDAKSKSMVRLEKDITKTAVAVGVFLASMGLATGGYNYMRYRQFNRAFEHYF